LPPGQIYCIGRPKNAWSLRVVGIKLATVVH
jgi:hypothetical protein